MNAAIWWIRRDLRLADSAALAAASQEGITPIPLFIEDPKLWNESLTGARRLSFLAGGLHSLSSSLRELGSQLVYRRGNPREVLAELMRETGAQTIYSEADYSPLATRRDSEIMGQLPLKLVDGLTVVPPGAVLKADGQPYRVFTPFSKEWKRVASSKPVGVLQAPKRLPNPPELDSEPLPPTEPGLFPPSELSAQQRLHQFTGGRDAAIYSYARERNQLDTQGTSSLSPYLRFGLLSAGQAVEAAYRAMDRAPNEAAREAAQTWLTELIWREFYIHVLYHFPHASRGAFRPELNQIQWENNQREFEAWRHGMTGYPVVDSAMRQLLETGWIHNRARMIVASFLVKDLLVDWRWGERWFMQQLIDGDPAANNGGWQWVAGTGTDAAPYFRIFNPTAQGKKFDPNGDYVRSWIPELERVPNEYIHEPHRMSVNQQAEYGVVIGEDYPAPIVDHAQARKRTLTAYEQARTAG